MATRSLPLIAISALTLAGTALTVAAAYRYGLKHAHQHRARRSVEQEDDSAIAMSATTATTTATKTADRVKSQSEAPTRLSLLTTMLLQDASLLVIAMGLAIIGLALTVSLTLVVTSAGVTSLDDLSMFSSLMMIGVGMVVVGLLNAMLQYSNRKRSAAPGEVVLPVGHPPIPMETLKEMVELDEDGKPKKRISKCPFGF